MTDRGCESFGGPEDALERARETRRERQWRRAVGGAYPDRPLAAFPSSIGDWVAPSPSAADDAEYDEPFYEKPIFDLCEDEAAPNLRAFVDAMEPTLRASLATIGQVDVAAVLDSHVAALFHGDVRAAGARGRSRRRALARMSSRLILARFRVISRVVSARFDARVPDAAGRHAVHGGGGLRVRGEFVERGEAMREVRAHAKERRRRQGSERVAAMRAGGGFDGGTKRKNRGKRVDDVKVGECVRARSNGTQPPLRLGGGGCRARCVYSFGVRDEMNEARPSSMYPYFKTGKSCLNVISPSPSSSPPPSHGGRPRFHLRLLHRVEEDVILPTLCAMGSCPPLLQS